MVLSLPVRCDACERLVAAPVVGSYNFRTDDPYEPPFRTENLLLRCPDCDNPFLLQRHGIEDHRDWDYGNATTLYPRGRELDATVPKQVAASFNEASSCLTAEAYTACAIMCRRTLEALCAHHGVGKGTLGENLTKLKKSGVIEQRLFDWADQLRIVGNEAAHDVASVVPKMDARDLLEFTRALVEYVFTFTEAFRKFKERRQAVASARQGRTLTSANTDGVEGAANEAHPTGTE